jgi:hypothetical protein
LHTVEQLLELGWENTRDTKDASFSPMANVHRASLQTIVTIIWNFTKVGYIKVSFSSLFLILFIRSVM